MEHPFLVEEFTPAHTTHIDSASANRLAAAEPQSSAALPPLPNLSASEVLFLTPSDPQYASYLASANLRTQLSPALRAVCKTEHAVAVMIDWVRSNNLSFGIRCGGHSYEGFSQSQDVVIDLRGLQDISVDTTAGTITVGAGVSLYDVYQQLANEGYAFPAGSCPTVGIAGHVMGGGHGLLARSHGLTCDVLRQVTMIDCEGSTLQATANSEPDLFWACRGGGGGSFGIATQFVLSIFALTKVLVFGVSWRLSQSHAAGILNAWQTWAPNAPNSITSIMKLAGPLTYELVYMKAKSDYVFSPLASSAIADLLSAVAAVPVGGIAVLCDAYGGQIGNVSVADTAFPRRDGTQYCIQYFSSWQDASQSGSHLTNIANVYAAMRPYLPGAAYVNYCDLDLQNWADAYWGTNLSRLSSVKAAYDANNLFRHQQSVPVGAIV